MPLQRFRDLLKVDKLGKQTYFDLFRCLYSLALQSLQQNEQLNQSLLTTTTILNDSQTEQTTTLNNDGEEIKDLFDYIVRLNDM